MSSRFTGAILIGVLLLLPAMSALACWQMLAKTHECPMEPAGTQPSPKTTKMSCCYVSATELASGAKPFKMDQAAAAVSLPVIAAPAPTLQHQAPFSLHGPSPGHSSSLQTLYCVFLI